MFFFRYKETLRWYILHFVWTNVNVNVIPCILIVVGGSFKNRERNMTSNLVSSHFTPFVFPHRRRFPPHPNLAHSIELPLEEKVTEYPNLSSRLQPLFHSAPLPRPTAQGARCQRDSKLFSVAWWVLRGQTTPGAGFQLLRAKLARKKMSLDNRGFIQDSSSCALRFRFGGSLLAKHK